MRLRYSGLPTDLATSLRRGGTDANGQAPERKISDGDGVPCRHCLGYIEAGAPYLVFAYRPFPRPQPYAELGPVFIHADGCRAYDPAAGLPVRDRDSGEQRILRGYGADDRIVYGTGVVVEAEAIDSTAAQILARDDVAYVHMRSATNNCWTLRIDRES
jgi:hypothetical protein